MSHDDGRSAADADELTQLIRLLHETQQRIFELTGGEVDAVLHPSGASYLLTRAQQQLRDSEARYRRLFEGIPQPMWVYDAETLQFLAVNQAAIRQYEYSADEFLRMTIRDIRPPEQVARLEERLALQKHDAERFSIWQHRTKSGRVIDAEISSHAIEFGGRPARMVLSVDITQRLQYEHVLRLTNEQLSRSQRLMANAERIAHLGSWDFDTVSNTVIWSAETYRIFGVTPETFDGGFAKFIALVHPDDRIRLQNEHARGLAGESPLESRYRIRRPDGTERTVDERGEAIVDDQGNSIRLTGVVIDITERLALEEQLLQAQRLETLGQLTGGVAHDFNNLLTVILGNAELMVEELETAPHLRPLAEMIGSAAQRGAELTQRLLAFARRQALDPRAVDINGLVKGMDDLLRRTLGEHIAIEQLCAADLPPALVDPAQLESALLNLCINARDAMPTGGRLTIETRTVVLDEEYAEQHVETLPGEYVLLAVTDTGMGIAPENLARVFEPFFTTKEKGKGTGLGLSMVYGFIKQSRGHINLYSEVGRGTTVKLYLPRDMSMAMPTTPRIRNSGRIGGSETILLVEDDELVRRYVVQQLIKLGYNVLVAVDGPQALTILHTDVAITLLFTDIVMPGGMSGRELADAARILRPDLKVLYTSGYTENAMVHHGRLDPGVHLLSKPYRSAELAQRIREALEAS